MAICLFVRKFIDGSGDIVHTVKVADFLQRYIESSTLEALQNEEVIIVVEDEKNEAIVNFFVKDINPKIQVKKISVFKEENHKVNCCIEAAYSQFDWKKELVFTGEKPPLILMPEYDNDICIHDPSHGPLLKILGGFDTEGGDMGVIPSLPLLAATAEEVIHEKALKTAFEQLDPKLQLYLGQSFNAFLAHRNQCDFTYQYSHDRTKYLTFRSKENELWKYEEEVVDGEEYAPVEFFLKEHVMLVGDSHKSQDVLCIGESLNRKKKALVQLKKELINKGFTRISFIDVAQNVEEVIHENDMNEGGPKKEYRVLYSKSMPFTSMQVLPLIATDFIGTTGDQSLVEAMSAKKLVTYECVYHKRKFALGYLKAVERELVGLEEAFRNDVLKLARFLIKPNYRPNTAEYIPGEVCRLLNDEETVKALKNINRKLVEQSQYLESIEKLLISAVIPYIERQQSSVHLSELSDKSPDILTSDENVTSPETEVLSTQLSSSNDSGLVLMENVDPDRTNISNQDKTLTSNIENTSLVPGINLTEADKNEVITHDDLEAPHSFSHRPTLIDLKNLLLQYKQNRQDDQKNFTYTFFRMFSEHKYEHKMDAVSILLSWLDGNKVTVTRFQYKVLKSDRLGKIFLEIINSDWYKNNQINKDNFLVKVNAPNEKLKHYGRKII